MQKVLLVAVVKAFHQLSHETAYMLLRELDQARLQKPHQVVVHVLKHQIEGTLTHREQCADSKLGLIHNYHTLATLDIRHLQSGLCIKRFN